MLSVNAAAAQRMDSQQLSPNVAGRVVHGNSGYTHRSLRSLLRCVCCTRLLSFAAGFGSLKLNGCRLGTCQGSLPSY
jgi:hypothetical protein